MTREFAFRLPQRCVVPTRSKVARTDSLVLTIHQSLLVDVIPSIVVAPEMNQLVLVAVHHSPGAHEFQAWSRILGLSDEVPECLQILVAFSSCGIVRYNRNLVNFNGMKQRSFLKEYLLGRPTGQNLYRRACN